MKPQWWVWVLIGLLAADLLLSAAAMVRPVMPVASLTNALYAAGGDARVLLLRVQQLEQALQTAQAEIDRLKKGGK